MRSFVSKWCDVGTFHFKKKYIKKPAIIFDAGFFVMHEGDELRLVPPKLDFPRMATITKIFDYADGIYVCQVNDEKDAKFYQNIDGMHALMLRSGVEEDKSPFDMDFTGWSLKCMDSDETFSIVECEEMPTQLLLHIVDDKEENEMSVPLHEDFIADVDEKKKVLTCKFPFSLQDLVYE